MTVGELRAALDDLPDNFSVRVNATCTNDDIFGPGDMREALVVFEFELDGIETDRDDQTITLRKDMT